MNNPIRLFVPAIAALFVLVACERKPADVPAPVTGSGTSAMPAPMTPASAASPTN